MTFYDSIHCTSEAHCQRCRSLRSGQSFRESLLRTFPELDVVDFECPKGKDWINDYNYAQNGASGISLGSARREGKKYHHVEDTIKLLPDDHPAVGKYKEARQALKESSKKDNKSRLIDNRRIRNSLIRVWEKDYVLG